MNTPDKFKNLLGWFENLSGVAIAFSGGVDSTFVLAAAQKVHGTNILALTVKTPYIPDWELEEAVDFCRTRGIRHQIVHANILPAIMNNPKDRCYLCKHHIFTKLRQEALQAGFSHLVDGSNADDTEAYRPGLAALRELGIRSPLLENGINKHEVRQFSFEMGLPTAEKPSYACLLTRLPYYYPVIPEELIRIEKAERHLFSLGYGTSRVRNHGEMARIEMAKESMSSMVTRKDLPEIIAYFREIGYKFVTLDLEGYRSGSFDGEKNQEP